ncbi:hypothetical protein NEOLI_002393 [Neolecta irregularis DAH-3]|uniref:Uncharacterized protein n=1 Tax=Neolecta irregularis (strain DAH-3) TaxID=1198029 RepID=A0A1U7LJE0_NEOID|nr:hypothetical protein NEOLI_002393 [Neolecta irregularis DAH-3]|eukprot:OLL22748.1 hypothetical protein NEOLI_002393 [Neolecta irregularis DAH-3]
MLRNWQLAKERTFWRKPNHAGKPPLEKSAHEVQIDALLKFAWQNVRFARHRYRHQHSNIETYPLQKYR